MSITNMLYVSVSKGSGNFDDFIISSCSELKFLLLQLAFHSIIFLAQQLINHILLIL